MFFTSSLTYHTNFWTLLRIPVVDILTQNYCFELAYASLVFLQILRLARELGDFLLVGIHTDQTVRYDLLSSLFVNVQLSSIEMLYQKPDLTFMWLKNTRWEAHPRNLILILLNYRALTFFFVKFLLTFNIYYILYFKDRNNILGFGAGKRIGQVSLNTISIRNSCKLKKNLTCLIYETVEGDFYDVIRNLCLMFFILFV